jgi:hypothetical protein
MVEFKSENGTLYIDGKKVVKGWEAYSGWYWFATEKDSTQDSVLADGKVIKDDIIWFGLVQGQYEEWGYFSEGELKILGPKVWEIPKRNLPWSGRRQTPTDQSCVL